MVFNAGAESASAQAFYSSAVMDSAPVAAAVNAVNEVGITVPGSVSEQKFRTAYIGALDGVKHVMVLRLVGKVGEAKVVKPVTVKTKQKCTSCGRVNKATSKCCSECGTGLVLIK